jgi:site-specific DNA recombinase
MKRKTKQAERWDAGYPRVSTDIQLERDALQNQVQALEGHALAHGLTMRLYREEGVSAKDTDRPALQRLLADIRAGKVRSVAVTKLDRISRSLHDLLDLMKLFEAHDVKFVSLRDNIDTSGPVGRFMLHILGAIAELERGIIGERVAEDMKLRARRGRWNGGLTPYGRKLVDGRLIVVPDEAEMLRQMRRLLLQHRSWRGVAVALNRAGMRTRGWEPIERNGRTIRKGHAPAEWTPVSVKRVLLQPINDGTLVYNRRRVVGRAAIARPEDEHVVVEGFCAPIFAREELAELRRVAKEIAATPPRRAGSPHLLSGLLRCACGTKMYGVTYPVATRRGRYSVRYYKCRRATSTEPATRRLSAPTLSSP